MQSLLCVAGDCYCRLDAWQESVSKSPLKGLGKGPAVSSAGSNEPSPAISGVNFLEDGSLDPFQQGILSVVVSYPSILGILTISSPR